MRAGRSGRIAITGVGIFSAAGRDLPSFTHSLLSGTGAIGPIDLFDVEPFPSRIGAQVRGFDPLDYLSRRQAARTSRADQFALIAAGEALYRSCVLAHYSPYDIGVCVGAGTGGMLQSERWLQQTVAGRRPRPSPLRGLLPDRTATTIADHFNLCGYQCTITTACSSSATSIGWAADLVASGRVKAAICGGSDCLSLLSFAGFSALKVVDPEPCSPFSLGRRGITLGEGAAFMVLECEEEAVRRGAQMHGFILGYAVAGEACHMTAPEPDGTVAACVMKEAMRRAGVSAEEIGWVSAHGTGTPADLVESKAMKLVFHERAPEVPLVSVKGMTGHCLGAAGAIEAVAAIAALKEGIVPQTLNFRGRDPECDLDYCHAGPKACGARVVLSNSFAFGGNTTSLILSV